ncbi:MAG: PspC domain-containing protein [Gammaproteobacteria bacterium]|nr:PspC domain-containing protein [Gammaproteobacteria bacterium]
MNSQPQPKRLFRSRKQKVIGGVCGGMAEYFNIDTTWVRLILVIFSFLFLFSGPALMAIGLYIIAWAVIPLAPESLNSYSSDTYITHD